MAINDIYNNKERYSRFVEEIPSLTKPNKRRKYYCKDPANLKYYKRLCTHFDAQDISYVRRLRLLQTFKVVTHHTEKDLEYVTRDDINNMIILGTTHLSDKTKCDFKTDIKHLWKLILPDLDEKGNPDETQTPYIVRHLSTKLDKSRQKTRADKLTYEEYTRIIEYFSDKPVLQAYLTVAFESLARPQELLWRKIKDLELNDNYAIINLSDHTKEGIGIAQVIDSYAYLTSWLNQHPQKNKPEAWLFCNKQGNQHTPYSINKHLRIATERLNINKPVTCYSLKRNGVTFRRLRGDSDVEIQHAARWTSTQQLKTYDLSNQREALKRQLIKKGLIKATEEYKDLQPQTRPCIFCKTLNKYTDTTCINCKRPLDREKILLSERKREIEMLYKFMQDSKVQEMFKEFVRDIMNEQNRGLKDVTTRGTKKTYKDGSRAFYNA